MRGNKVDFFQHATAKLCVSDITEIVGSETHYFMTENVYNLVVKWLVVKSAICDVNDHIITVIS